MYRPHDRVPRAPGSQSYSARRHRHSHRYRLVRRRAHRAWQHRLADCRRRDPQRARPAPIGVRLARKARGLDAREGHTRDAHGQWQWQYAQQPDGHARVRAQRVRGERALEHARHGRGLIACGGRVRAAREPDAGGQRPRAARRVRAVRSVPHLADGHDSKHRRAAEPVLARLGDAHRGQLAPAALEFRAEPARVARGVVGRATPAQLANAAVAVGGKQLRERWHFADGVSARAGAPPHESGH